MSDLTVRKYLLERRSKAIRNGLVLVILQLLGIAAVLSRLSLVNFSCQWAGVCLRLTAIDHLPSFYLLVCVAGLCGVAVPFGGFMLSFANQADTSQYNVVVRPAWLIALFTLSSVSFLIIMFAGLNRWIGISGDTWFVCKDGICQPQSQTVYDLGTCLYFSVITITTVGYGDYHPRDTLASHVISGTEALSGYLLLGLLVSSLAVMLRRP